MHRSKPTALSSSRHTTRVEKGGKAVDVSSGNTAEGAGIIQWPYSEQQTSAD